MSKAKLIEALIDAEKLLIECGLADRAAWIKKKRANIGARAPGSHEFQKELKALRAVLVGMGSFSDLPMYPRAGSDMTILDARNKQWELTEKLGALMDDLFASRKARSPKSR